MQEVPGQRGAGRARRRTPWLVVGTTVAMLLVVGGAAAAYFAMGPLVRTRITEEARRRGVELVFSDAQFFFWSASLDAVRFRLVGVPELEGTAKIIDVSLASLEPRQIDGTDVKLSVTGSAADLSLAIAEWTRAHPQAFVVPVSAHGVSVAMRAAASEAPWLTIEGGEMGRSAAGTTFSATHATVSGVDVGSVGASWAADTAAVTMSFGAADPKAAPVRLTVHHAATPPTATVTLAPTELSRLTGPLGVPLSVPGVTASGQADLTFAGGLGRGPVTGRLEARLEGWIPPHPVELDGFLFGTTTTLASKLDVDAARTTVELTESRVRAALFDLSGSGRIDRAPGFATIQMSLAGNLPCSAVAESAAAAHVGSFLAELVGTAARRTVSGSVAVRVGFVADTRNLAAANVTPTIGIGCGLTPLRGVDPKVLRQLPSRLQDFVLRALPALPDLPIPGAKREAAPRSP